MVERLGRTADLPSAGVDSQLLALALGRLQRGGCRPAAAEALGEVGLDHLGQLGSQGQGSTHETILAFWRSSRAGNFFSGPHPPPGFYGPALGA